MEFFGPGITKLLTLQLHTPKTRLMIQRKFLNRLIILAFMFLVGISLANSIIARSMIGFLLALTSLGAGIYFLHLLARANDSDSSTDPGKEQEERA